MSNIENLKRHPSEDSLTPNMCTLRQMCWAHFHRNINRIDVIHTVDICMERGIVSLLCAHIRLSSSHIKSCGLGIHFFFILIMFGVSVRFEPCTPQLRIFVKVYAMVFEPYRMASILCTTEIPWIMVWAFLFRFRSFTERPKNHFRWIFITVVLNTSLHQSHSFGRQAHGIQILIVWTAVISLSFCAIHFWRFSSYCFFLKKKNMAFTSSMDRYTNIELHW